MNKDAAHPGIIRVDRWLSIFLLLIAFNANAHQGFYVEAGLGKNDVFDYNDWIGRESAGAKLGFGYVYAPSPNVALDFGFSHYSQWTRGEGFDDRAEDHLDVLYLSGRYYF